MRVNSNSINPFQIRDVRSKGGRAGVCGSARATFLVLL